MDFSKLSYAKIQDMANNLKRCSSEMESILSDIKSKFGKVGDDSVWSGTAAATTKETFDELSSKFPEFYQAIDDCYKYLIQVVENYKSVDAAITNGN